MRFQLKWANRGSSATYSQTAQATHESEAPSASVLWPLLHLFVSTNISPKHQSDRQSPGRSNPSALHLFGNWYAVILHTTNISDSRKSRNLSRTKASLLTWWKLKSTTDGSNSMPTYYPTLCLQKLHYREKEENLFYIACIRPYTVWNHASKGIPKCGNDSTRVGKLLSSKVHFSQNTYIVLHTYKWSYLYMLSALIYTWC